MDLVNIKVTNIGILNISNVSQQVIKCKTLFCCICVKTNINDICLNKAMMSKVIWKLKKQVDCRVKHTGQWH